MCGIAGWLSPHPISSSEKPRLKNMIDSIDHRGPDGTHCHIYQHAALAHARLAIIDLDTGSQPMSCTNNRLHIVFNGEIYNYQELRRDLVKQGLVFATHSDTEVILNLYQLYGDKAFNKLRGMYAFVIWDSENRQAILARDPLGIKPMFIHQTAESELFFASEAKAIFRFGIQCELNPSCLHQVLNFRYIPGNNSMFKNVSQLPPGTVIIWKPQGATHSKRIDSVDVEPLPVLDALRDSVNLHLTSDVEVGCYLSGGIDSATITQISKQTLQSPLRTFTLKVGDDPNEAEYARRSAALIDVANIQSNVEVSLAEYLPRMIWHLEVPKINSLQVSLLAKLSSSYVKVCLSGLGGDELFYGYNVHRYMNIINWYHRLTPSLLNKLLGHSAARIIAMLSTQQWTESERVARIAANMGNWPHVYSLIRNIWDSPRLRRELYGPRLLDISHELPQAQHIVSEYWPAHKDPTTSLGLFEWRNKMVNDLLWQEDRLSMAEGLEVRVPFVDVHLAERIRNLTRNKLMKFGQPKSLMRRELQKLLPKEILQRPKSGFQISSPEFFHKYLKSAADDILSERRVKEYGFFNYRFIRAVLNTPPRKGLRWHYFMLYFMLLTHIWSDVFEHQSYNPNQKSS